jgi:hypothetical protein
MTKKKVVYENFKSISELLSTMEKRPMRNQAFTNKPNLASQEDETSKKKPWSGTETYNQAMEIMKTGYKDPLEKMKKAILKIGQNEKSNRPKLKNDFVGFIPHVPNTLMGLPITMINKEKQENKAKTIHLIYSISTASKVKPDEMVKGGINFISLVNSLEKQGYRVKIDIMSCFATTKTLSSFSVNVKEYGQKLNLLKLTFPLVHPSMLRRIAFKWLETNLELKDKDFTTAYGTPLSYLMNYDVIKESNYLKDHGIIKNDNTFFCTVYEAMKTEDIQSLAKTIGVTK